MRYLLDTHTFLWMAAAPEKLSVKARNACEKGDLLLSVASVWEVGIKYHLGSLPLPEEPRAFFDRNIRMAGVTVLPVHYKHVLTAAALPMHHKDPFDRLLAAQSLEEELACISIDEKLDLLCASRIW